MACSVRWTGVAAWNWIANDMECGICWMPFDGCCPYRKIPGDDCASGKLAHFCTTTRDLIPRLLAGKCKHSFSTTRSTTMSNV